MAFYNKKGNMHYAMLVIMIAAIAFLLISIVFTGGLYELVKWSAPQEACRMSVWAKARTKWAGAESPAPLKCEVKYLESKAENKEEAFKLIADQLKACWHNYHEGNLDFLSDYDFGGSEIKCYACAEIRFSEFTDKVESAELASYLQNTMMPGQKKTYWEYLFKQAETKGSGEGFSLGGDNVLYVAFVASKIPSSNEPIFGVFGKAIRLLFLKKGFARGVAVLDGEGIAEKCDL